jgi:gluconate 2-dehydrogenase gamma chain
MMLIDRRMVLAGLSAAGTMAFLDLPGLEAQAAALAEGHRPLSFLSGAEAELLGAMCDRLIPEDDFPSASQAGVVDFIDLQLAGEWGQGAGFYAKSPYFEGKPEQGYQLPLTPAKLYRTALHGILSDNGTRFLRLSGGEQDAFLTELEKDRRNPGKVPGSVFFATLLHNTVEGYFADPIYGGNRGYAGWRMVGFPGAHAFYLAEISRHNLAYDRPPSGIGDDLRAVPRPSPVKSETNPQDRRG